MGMKGHKEAEKIKWRENTGKRNKREWRELKDTGRKTPSTRSNSELPKVFTQYLGLI